MSYFDSLSQSMLLTCSGVRQFCAFVKLPVETADVAFVKLPVETADVAFVKLPVETADVAFVKLLGMDQLM